MRIIQIFLRDNNLANKAKILKKRLVIKRRLLNMEWTREKRYLPYEKWDAKTLLKLQSQAARSDYQLHYHIRPTSGLLNDPNGFS